METGTILEREGTPESWALTVKFSQGSSSLSTLPATWTPPDYQYIWVSAKAVLVSQMGAEKNIDSPGFN